MKTAVLESAEYDPATGCMVLRINGRKPLFLTAAPAVLWDLKAAVLDSYAHSVRTPMNRVADSNGDGRPAAAAE
jgi:hypothetical protein